MHPQFVDADPPDDLAPDCARCTLAVARTARLIVGADGRTEEFGARFDRSRGTEARCTEANQK